MKKNLVIIFMFFQSITIPLFAYSQNYPYQIPGKVRFFDEDNKPFSPTGSFKIIVRGLNPLLKTNNICGGSRQVEARVDPHPDIRDQDDVEYQFLYPIPNDCQNLNQLEIDFKMGNHDGDWKPRSKPILYTHKQNKWYGPEPSPIAIVRTHSLPVAKRDEYFRLALKEEYSNPDEAFSYFEEASRGDDFEYTQLAAQRLVAAGNLKMAQELLRNKNITALPIKTSQKVVLLEQLASIEEELGQFPEAVKHYEEIANLDHDYFLKQQYSDKIVALNDLSKTEIGNTSSDFLYTSLTKPTSLQDEKTIYYSLGKSLSGNDLFAVNKKDLKIEAFKNDAIISRLSDKKLVKIILTEEKFSPLFFNEKLLNK